MDEPSSPEGTLITLRIKFRSASLDEFVARYGADVSAGGIFIRTKQPLTVGVLLRFDFGLADGSPLMAGMGTVVWVREPDPARVGSVPGMGLRFDQLAPESQQTHQQILAAKARRGDRPAGTPAPSAVAAPATRPSVGPATSPPFAARPVPATSVAAQRSDTGVSSKSDEFDVDSKTEIADRPPSFYFDGLDSARGAAADARPAEEAAPRAALDSTETDSHPIIATDLSWPEPIDVGEDASKAVLSPGAAAAQAVAAELRRFEGAGDELAPESLDLSRGGGPEPAPVAGLPPPPGRGAGAATADAPPLNPAAEQSWLDRAMKMADGTSAAPVETHAERTEETAAPVDVMQPELHARASGGADRPAARDAEAFGQDFSDVATNRPVGESKKLIVVGIAAAGLAFAGVYLLQAKPWHTRVAPVSRPAPAEPAPSSVAPLVAPKLGAPSQPAAQPTPPPRPTEAPANTKPEVIEAAKPDQATEAAKRLGPATESGKKTASKLTLSSSPSSGAPAGQSEIVFLVKVRSLPSGAQVLIDGEPMGQTPFQRRILDTEKNHAVTVRKPGYEPYEHIVSPSDAWVKEGNTEIMKLVAKLTKIKVQAAAPSAVPQATPQPVPALPEKP